MSMREYAVHDYGLLLTPETMKKLAEKHCHDFNEQAYADEEWSFCERVEEIFDGNIDCIGQFTGEAFLLEDDGTVHWGCNSVGYYDDAVYYVPINCAVSLFKAAYENMEEMINDFKDRVGKYMPDDFNYRDNICQIVGTYWG